MTYLMDTNVLSEVRRRRGDPAVRAWFSSLSPEVVHISVLVVGEIRDGIERLRPRDPTRAGTLEAWLTTLASRHERRLLPVDVQVADAWGRLRARPEPLPFVDGILAATAQVHDLTVATRNVAHFERAGVRVLNPWLDLPTS